MPQTTSLLAAALVLAIFGGTGLFDGICEMARPELSLLPAALVDWLMEWSDPAFGGIAAFLVLYAAIAYDPRVKSDDRVDGF